MSDDKIESPPGELEKWQMAVWNSALAAWSAGDGARAFHFCQALLAAGHFNRELFHLLTLIALQFGQYDQAAQYLTNARSFQLKAPPSKGHQYLVIKPWGCGFWGEVDHVMGQLAIAEITGRTPIVDWVEPFQFAVPGIENAWSHYFEPVSKAAMNDVERPDVSFYPPKWELKNIRQGFVNRYEGDFSLFSTLNALSANEDVVVADMYTRMLDILAWVPAGSTLSGLSASDAYRFLFEKYVRPSSPISKEVDRFVAERLRGWKTLAVHLRTPSSDKTRDAAEKRAINGSEYVDHIDRFLSHTDGGRVFLLTDFQPAVVQFATRYGSRLIHREATRLEHIGQTDLSIDRRRDGAALGVEVALDVWTAVKCDQFLGDGASGVSSAIYHLKRWPADGARLLREPVFLKPGRIEWPLS